MRVKQLELFGFKSFSNKTTIRFEAGVTAIVGPNGSGKCVHGGSRVILADGRVVPIKELVEVALRDSSHERWDDGLCTYENPQQLHVFSLNPQSLQVEARPIAAFIKRKSPETLHRIVTKTGRALIATGYHPLFTLENGELRTLPADQLRPGIRIAIPRRLPVANSTDQLDGVDILRRFEREDRVYVPYSTNLESWIDELAVQQGSLAQVTRGAGVDAVHVRTIRQKQALNVATVSRLRQQYRGSTPAWLGQTLQSHTHGMLTVPQQLTPALARFLGYCISEGRSTESDQIWFVNSDPALVDDFCQCVRETFDLEARVFSYKSCAKDVIVFSRTLCQYLEKAFQVGIGSRSSEKQVPTAFFGASDEVLLAFLSALFEGDGHLCIKRNASTGKTQAYLEYATASRRLADDVSLLLLRFGIVGRIQEKWKAATNTEAKTRRLYFSVMVYGIEQLRRLAEVLEFRGAKRKLLEEWRQLNHAPNPNDDVVPGATRLVKSLVKEAHVPIKPLRAQYPTLSAYVDQRCEATRPGLCRVLEAVSRYGRQSQSSETLFQHLQLLSESDVYWDEIVRIEPYQGEEWVYDLAVEGHHNFIANGIIVHNSNIVDSIRWVLGEHNPRDVRAPRLEDVIFNGTDTKAPLSLAEVSLTIENDRGLLPIAFTELAITRRVYRSGESEYLINNAPCRLKDIQELFLGTGLGGGTYAIIEQGHIDMILSSKPEERRGVFEEASGIAKYLSKRRETIRRLDEVEQHLTRLADIIAEVRRQLGALERQAAKARRYKTQWEQLKAWEIRLAADELKGGEQLQRTLQEQVSVLTQQRQGLDQQKQSLLTSLETCNAAVSRTQATLQDVRTRVMECTSQIEQHTSQLGLKTTWIEELSRQREQMTREVAQLEERHRAGQEHTVRFQEQLGQLEQQCGETREQHSRMQAELAALEQSMSEALKAVDQFKAELFGIASEASQQRNALAAHTQRLQAVNGQIARRDEQRTTILSRIDSLTQRQQELEQERATYGQQRSALQQQLAAVQQTVSQAQAVRHELMGRLNQVREQLVSQRARVQLLEEAWQRYEGFPETVKTLLSQTPEGVVGLLADLVEAQSGYEHALEVALGPLSSAIVVRDREALRRCQELLRQQGLEAAQFVSLSDAVQAERSPERLSHYVRCDVTYRALVDWLLAPWGVVEDINRVLGHSTRPSGSWVAPSGEAWDGRMWHLAGRPSSGSFRIGRKQRWERAKEELAALEQRVAQLQTGSDQAQAQWQQLVDEEARIRGQDQQIMPTLTKLEGQLTQLTHELKRAQDELSSLAFDHRELAEQQRTLQEAEGSVRHAVESAETRQQALEVSLNEARTRHQTGRERQQQMTINLAQLDTTIRSFDDRLEAVRGRIEEVQRESQQVSGELEAKRSQREGTVTRLEELATQLESHRTQVTTLTEERGRLNAEVEQAASSLREDEQRRDEVLPKVLEAEQQLLSLIQTLQAHETQLAQRLFRRTRILERLQDVYHIGEAAVLAEAAGPATPTAVGARSQSTPLLTEDERASLTEQTQQLKAKLEAIGPVSLGSVEEYDELTKRSEFLQNQQHDLLKAKTDLRESIHQINRSARQQFRDTFAKIREEFRHYFTRLFGGGEADLMLMDEEDVLESGIEIVARPPGKRLQSISLLSGGERALTAIALLFALFKVRPSPFCILDEIDAPLDEANVDRFTRVLEEFLSLSQFILITHNKKTITKADCLYGVTMEQPGISKIVSVKLTKSEPPQPPAARDRAPTAVGVAGPSAAEAVQ